MKFPNQPLKIGVVGLGWVGQARHIPTINSSRSFRLVGVADRASERTEAFSAKHPEMRCSTATNLHSVEWIDDVDAVSIATAPMAHHRLVCEALELGKHVITEKPFAMTVAEGEDMVAKAASAQRRLAVVHNFQFARSMQRLERDLEAGTLGKVRAIRAIQLGNPARRLPVWYEQLPFGLFYDESPHLLYLLRRLAGPLELSKAVVAPSSRGLETPLQVDAWFGSPSDALVSLSCNFEASLSEWFIAVHAERGVGIVDIFRDIYIRLPNDGGHTAKDIISTSILATWHHWAQHGRSGLMHVLGKLRYGNDHVFANFAAGIAGDDDAFRPIDAHAALQTLSLQHKIIEESERIAR